MRISSVVATLGLIACLSACGSQTEPTEPKASAAATNAEPASSGDPGSSAQRPAPTPVAAVEPTEVVLWHAYRAAEKAALETVIAQLNETHPSVRIRAQAVPYDPFVDKITITIPRGQGPDLFIFAHNMIGAWAEDELLESMSKSVDSETLKTFLPQTVTPLVHEGNLYGLPLAFKSLVLFYNKKLLPEMPVSMEQLVEALVKVQKATPGVHGLVAEAGLLYNHAPWMHAFDGKVFDASGQPALNSPEQVRAASWVRSLHTEHGVLPSGMSGFMVSSLFNEGKAAVALNGPWFRAELASNLDVGVSVIPPLEGRLSRPFLGVEAIFVSRRSKQKAAAIEAAKLLAGSVSAGIRMRQGKQPVAHKETLEAGAKEDPSLGIFLSQASSAVPMSARPEMQLIWSTMDMAVQGVVFGKKSAKKALDAAQDKAKSDIAKRGK